MERNEISVRRTFDLLNYVKEKYPQSMVVAGKPNGVWERYTIEEFIQYANWISSGLLAKGFSKGDKIATIINSRPEWNFLDMGMSQIGVVHVPLYPNVSVEEYITLFKHSESKAAFIGNKVIYQRTKPAIDQVSDLQIYTIDAIDQEDTLEDIIKIGKETYEKNINKIEEIKNSILPSDLLSIIYTSGTTGSSKGVMLSHENIVSNFIGSAERLPLVEGDKAISFLPLCHIFERMLIYLYLYKGISINYAQNLGTVVRDIAEIKAEAFTTVPRFLEKVYDQIISKGNALKGIKKKIFFWAVEIGLQYEPYKSKGFLYDWKLNIARKLVLSKWKEALGGNIKMIVSGGAALQDRLNRIFWAAGMPVQEGYGLTETSPVIAVNGFKEGEIKVSTVGLPLWNVEVKIANDGEIICKGPNVMKGYYKDPEYTKQVIDEEGWFHTGDIGVFVDNKYLKITDRKKSIFKISSGKYIAPQVIENKLKESEFIEQALVVGENEKVVGVLISPNFSFLQSWASTTDIDYLDNNELISISDVQKLYSAIIEKINTELSPHEHIKKIKIVSDEWLVESGELSLTLKLKRDVLISKYTKELETMYGHEYNTVRD